MTVRFLVFLLAQCSITLFAQDMIRISGEVTDDETHEKLPYAQVSLSVSNIGTVTNADGLFTLEFPVMFAKDSVLVAYLGYQTARIPIAGLKVSEPFIVKMKPAPLQLKEVEIISFTPEEVIRHVVEKIPENYGVDSLLLTAFIRSQKYVGNKLAEFTEAIVEDLKTGYSLYNAKSEDKRHRSSNIPALIRGRVKSDTNLVNLIGDIGRSAGCLGCNFVHDFVEFYHNTVLDEQLFKFYNFRMEEMVTPEGKIYHLWFDQRKGVNKKLWKGELFVNAADFALLKITQRPSFEAYETYEKDKFKRSFVIDGKPGWVEEMPRMEWTTTYSRRNGSYYLSTIRIENWLTFIHPASNKVIKFSHKNEVVVTNATRDRLTIRNFKGDKSIGVNQRWDQVVGQGDEEFWRNYNYLPEERK